MSAIQCYKSQTGLLYLLLPLSRFTRTLLLLLGFDHSARELRKRRELATELVVSEGTTAQGWGR